MAGRGGRGSTETAIILSFVLVLLVSGVAFGVTVAGHIALMQSDSIEVTVENTRYSPGSSPTIDVELQVHNPTPRAITFVSAEGIGLVVDGETVLRSTTPEITPWPLRVPANGAAQTTARIRLEAPSTSLKTAIREDRIEVETVLIGRIGTERVQVSTGGESRG